MDELKDITPEIEVGVEKEEEKEEKKGKEIPEEDHHLIWLLDESVKHCNNHAKELNRKYNADISLINEDAYSGFVKPFINKALWYYLPDTDVDDPKLCAAVGAVGFAFLTAPTIAGILKHYSRRKREKKREEIEKEEETKEVVSEETEEKTKRIKPKTPW